MHRRKRHLKQAVASYQSFVVCVCVCFFSKYSRLFLAVFFFTAQCWRVVCVCVCVWLSSFSSFVAFVSAIVCFLFCLFSLFWVVFFFFPCRNQVGMAGGHGGWQDGGLGCRSTQLLSFDSLWFFACACDVWVASESHTKTGGGWCGVGVSKEVGGREDQRKTVHNVHTSLSPRA